MLKHKFFAPEGDATGGGAADAGAAAAGSAAPSMEDTIRSTYRELMSAGEPEGDEGDAGGADNADAQSDANKEPKHKSQPREKGRFAAKADQPGAGEDAEAGQQGSQPDPQQQQQQAQPKPHDALPNTWRKELAEEWKALPEKSREEIHKREQDFHNGVRQYKEAAGFGASIAQEMMPYQQVMRDRGTTPQAVVRDIMGALNTMVTGSEESKAQVFLKMASDYGINLDTLQTLRQRAPAGAAPDLSPVLQRVQQIETRIQTADQERQQLQQQEDDERVQSFLNDPKNEHAKTVAKQMSALLISGQAKDLPDAYEQAIWVHPEVRTKLLAKQDEQRRTKEAADAAAARKAAAANVTRRGTPPAPAKQGTMEDTIRSTYRRLTAG